MHSVHCLRCLTCDTKSKTGASAGSAYARSGTMATSARGARASCGSQLSLLAKEGTLLLSPPPLLLLGESEVQLPRPATCTGLLHIFTHPTTCTVPPQMQPARAAPSHNGHACSTQPLPQAGGEPLCPTMCRAKAGTSAEPVSITQAVHPWPYTTCVASSLLTAVVGEVRGV